MITRPQVNQILETIRKRRAASRTTKADIVRIIEAQRNSDWTLVHRTRLYIKHSGEYCELLLVICYHDIKGAN